jgi:hypothetical protein
MKQTEAWVTGPRYLDMTALEEWSNLKEAMVA